MKRAAVYCRISADREGREAGVERQEQDCRELAQRLGYTIVGVYRDNDISASTRSRKIRPDYRRLLDAARAGKFEVILAYTSGRLTRRPREHEDLIDLAEQHGISFNYVKSPSFDLNTSAGRRVARILAANDAGEAEDIQERVKRQKEQAAANGQWRGGRRPYGFDVDGVTLRPDEADEIAHATREVLLGTSLRSLVADMNRRGCRTSTGRPWATVELRRVLLRGRNAGLVEARRPDGTMGVVAAAEWEAVVTRPEWEAVVRILRDPTRRTNKSNVARRWLGSGLYLCGVCGDGTSVRCGMTASSRTTASHNYHCAGGSKHLVRRADYVDRIVEGVMLGWLAKPEAAAHLAQRADVDVVAIQAELVALRTRLDEADDMFSSGELDRRRHTRIVAPIKAEMDEVSARLAAATATSPLAGILDADDIEAAWRRCDIPRRQAIVDVICEVVLLPGRKGRPPGWKPGERYFDEDSVEIKWR